MQVYQLFTNAHLTADNMKEGASAQRWRPPLPPSVTLQPQRIEVASQGNGRDCGIYTLTFMHRMLAAILQAPGPEGLDASAVAQLVTDAQLGRRLALKSKSSRKWWAEKLCCLSILDTADTL